MATSSGGVDWSQLVKPIITVSYSTANKQDIPELVKAIIKSKEDILQHEEQYEAFYSALCILAADYLAGNAHLLSVGSVTPTVSACKVLLQHLVSRVGCPAITLPIPSSIPIAHNHSHTHVSAHITSSPALSSTTTTPSSASSSATPNNARFSNAASGSSVLSPSLANILSSATSAGTSATPSQSVSSSLLFPSLNANSPPTNGSATSNNNDDQNRSENQNEQPTDAAPLLSGSGAASSSTNETSATAAPVTAVTTPSLATATVTTPVVTIVTPVASSTGKDEKEKVVNITDKHLVYAIKALCRGSSCLCRSDQAALVAAIRSAKVPPNVRIHSHEKDGSTTIKDGRRNRSDPSAAILEQLISPLHDLAGFSGSKAGRQHSGGLSSAAGMMTDDKEAEGGGADHDGNSEAADMRRLFGSRCEFALQSVGGGAILLDVCLRLPSINKFSCRYKELLEGRGFSFPSTMQEVHAFKAGLPQLITELGIVSRILQLPVMEPLNSPRLQQLAALAMAGLLAALHVATASAVTAVNAPTSTPAPSSAKTPPSSARDEELDLLAGSVAEKALLIFSVIIRAVCTSTRAGGHHYQNFQLMGAWLLSTGLHQLMVIVSGSAAAPAGGTAAAGGPTPDNKDKNKDDKGKSPTKKDSSQPRINLNKVQQGLSPVAVALSQQCCALLTALLEDVAVEGWSPSKPAPSPARLSVLETFSATERLARIFSAVPLNQLLFYLATVSYRKACGLRRCQRSFHDGDTYSLTDSTIYYEDDFSEGSLGEEDDDSVIIGSWFEEPSTPGGEDGGLQRGGSGGRSSSGVRGRAAWAASTAHCGGGSSQPHSLSDTESCSSGGGDGGNPLSSKRGQPLTPAPPAIPDKGEPHGFVSLATRIFSLMNQHLVECSCAYVQQYVRAGLTDAHMLVLAAIVKDLDRDTARSEAGCGVSLMGPVLQQLYEQFSQSLYRYTHNLIASGLLSDTLQGTLLQQLGVSPWLHDGDWPLLLLPRTLTILAQVLLLRQRRDKDELKCDCDTACVVIWQRVVNTLVKAVMSPSPQHHDQEVEDLNVEHAQLLLFLFHVLQLMQKKAVLLSVASALVTVAPVVRTPMRDSQLLHLSRLLLIFDYLMKNLYEAPQTLIEQVQWNLLKPISSEHSSASAAAAAAGTATTPVNNAATPSTATSIGQTNGTPSTGGGSAGTGNSNKMYHVWRDIEENYQKHYQGDEAGVIKPKFYTLAPVDTNSQDTPKLDGLACSFILATPDTLKYSTLYETLVGLLGVSCQVDPSLRASATSSGMAAAAADVTRSASSDVIRPSSSAEGGSSSAGGTPRPGPSTDLLRSVSADCSSAAASATPRPGSEGPLSFLGHCAVQYTFSLVYRILLTLPPSVTALEALASPDTKLEGPWLLHALIWGPRASHKVFNGWIKDGLVRQSLTTQKADALLKSVTNVTSSLQHDLRVAGQVVSGLVNKIHARTAAATTGGASINMTDVASFADLLLVDAVLARLQVTLDDGYQRGDLDLRGASDSHDLCQALKITADQLPVSSLLSLITLLTEAARHGVVLSIRSSATTSSTGGAVGAASSTKPPTTAAPATAAVAALLYEGSPVVEAYSRVLAVSGDHGGFVRSCLNRENRTTALNTALYNWTVNLLEGFPEQQSWKSSQCGGDVLPGENFVSGVVLGHVSALSASPEFSVASTPLKHVLRTLIAFTTDLASWYSESEKPHAQLVQTLVSIAADATCDGISSSVFTALDRLLPAPSAGDTAAASSGGGAATPPPPASASLNAGGQATDLTLSGGGGESGGSGSSSSSSSSGDSTTGGETTSSSGGSGGQMTVAHHLYGRLLVHVQALLKIAANYHGVIGDRVLSGLGSFLCRLLESSAGKQALRAHLQNSPHFCSILLSPIPPKSTALKSAAAGAPAVSVTAPGKEGPSTSSGRVSKAPFTPKQPSSEKEDAPTASSSGKSEADVDSNALPKPIVDFLVNLFQTAEKNPKDAELAGICNHIWSWVESGALQRWLTSALVQARGPPPATLPIPVPEQVPSAPTLVSLPRKRKDRKSSSKTKIVIDNPFSDPELMPLSFMTTASNIVTISTKNKMNEASVLDDDDLADDELADAMKDPEAIVDGLRLVLRLRDSWKLLRSMSGYVCAQETHVARNQCVSLLRSLESVGNVIVEGAVAAPTGREGARLLDPVTSLLPIMTSLAAGAGPQGHLSLFRTITLWLTQCKEVVLAPENTAVASSPSASSSGETTISTVSSSETSRLLAAADPESAGSLRPVHQLLEYLGNVLIAVKMSGELKKMPAEAAGPTTSAVTTDDGAGPLAAASGGDMLSAADTTDSDWLDDPNNGEDYEETSQEDSDEESVCNKLCTYTETQKEFREQHWYHCHTCQMEDGVGVCSICAKVCHKGHDVTYAKLGSFFCDCGAKDDNSCQALVKRSPGYSGKSASGGSGGSAFGSVGPLVVPSGPRPSKRPSSPQLQGADKSRDQNTKYRRTLSKQLEGVASSVCSSQQGVSGCVLQLLEALLPRLEQEAASRAAVTSANSCRKALLTLHSHAKNVETSDQLMFASIGSQEGAVENVRLNYSGEQGQTVRQLVATHVIRRVAMCCLAAPGSRRQHLAVSHEKGKITLLQLSSLLRQGDPSSLSSSASASKRKLTVTPVSSAPVPFMVLSINANPVNDDFLAVCGLKDCHVLVFANSGSVSDHLVLHPHLESGSYIIKSVWLPGQQTQLALVTADFVKIYDLSTDAISPQYYLLLPSGKIRDACFASLQDGSVHLILMTSSGYIYTQELHEDSSAKHGPFYVTNVLAVDQAAAELKDVSGVVGGGGVSVYYSHGLQLLCFSYTHGRSFMAPLTQLGENSKVDTIFPINMKPSSSSSSNNSTSSNNGSGGAATNSLGVTSSPGSSSKMSPLCQWAEVHGHPGLFTCLMLHSNTPVTLFVKPRSILVQEIKISPSKSKITDMIAIRHGSLSDQRTALVLLCEDGSFKVFTANNGATDYWLNGGENSHAMGAQNSISALRPPRKKKAPKPGSRTPGVITFPVDFFEHSKPIADIEFGGSDLLQVYNVQQLKNRLNSQSTYIACNKPGGFTLEAANKDTNQVICGVRIAVGGLDCHKNPSFIEVFGRSIPVNTSRSRWYDIPLSREESVQAEKKLVITFGPSSDQGQLTIVDTVKIYGKTKEDFGWADDVEDYSATANNAGLPVNGAANASSVPAGSAATVSGSRASPDGADTGSGHCSSSPSVLESLFCSALDTLDGCFSTTPGANKQYRQPAMAIATRLINLQLAPPLQTCTRSLLSSLHGSRQTYHQQLDSAQLLGVVTTLNSLHATGLTESSLMDCQAFHNAVVTARGVAVGRPHNLVRFTNVPCDADTTLVDQSNASPPPPPAAADEAVAAATTSSLNEEEQATPTTPVDQMPVGQGDAAASLAGETATLPVDGLPSSEAEDVKGVSNDTTDSDGTLEPAPEEGQAPGTFLTLLIDVFWMMHKARPLNPLLSPIYQPGLTHVESTVQAVVEVLHGYALCCAAAAPLATRLYCQLLFSPDHQVSFSAKSALVRLLRPRTKKQKRVFLPSPPRCSTPGDNKMSAGSSGQAGPSSSGGATGSSGESSGSRRAAAAAAAAAMDLPAHHGGGAEAGGLAGALAEVARAGEQLAGAAATASGGSGAELLAGMMELGVAAGGDDDDDAMMELAIALSLHDEGAGGQIPGIERLQHLRGHVLHSLLAAGALHNPAGLQNQQLNQTNDDDDDDDDDDDPEDEADHHDEDDDDDHEVDEDDDDDDEDDDDDDDDDDDEMVAMRGLNNRQLTGSGVGASGSSGGGGLQVVAGGSGAGELVGGGGGEDNQGGQFSDTTASANASDDDDAEVANVAADGGAASALMRASPADQACSGGSESGGSVVESLLGEQGSSLPPAGAGATSSAAAALDGAGPSQVTVRDADPQGESSSAVNASATPATATPSTSSSLSGVHALRLSLLDALATRMHILPQLGGLAAAPTLQVILMLSADLDPRSPRDRSTLDALLNALVTTLHLKAGDRPPATADGGEAGGESGEGAAAEDAPEDQSPCHERTPPRELLLLVMRLFGVMMSRSKTAASTTSVTRGGVTEPSAGAALLLPQVTANCLVKAGAMSHCLSLLQQLLPYWRNESQDTAGTLIGSILLKQRPAHPVPDISPFQIRPFNRSEPAEVFNDYAQLLTEMLLRLPYQVHKVCGNVLPMSAWSPLLCEYTLLHLPNSLRKLVRKLLLSLTGHRDKYRAIRDVHALDHHIKEVKVLCAKGGFNFASNGAMSPVSLPYDSLIQLIEHLKACVEIAQLRTSNWQKYCLREEGVLSFLLEAACLLDEGVAPTILLLLQAALCPSSDPTRPAPQPSGVKAIGSGSSLSRGSSSSKRASSEDSEAGADGSKGSDPLTHWPQLVAHVHIYLDRSRLSQFIHTFLLVSNSTSVRWQAHALVLALYRHSTHREQATLLELMWALWPRLSVYGRRAAQFVDLLGYFSLNTDQQDKVVEYANLSVTVLRAQSKLLASHPNASLYNALASLVHFDGYYLESEPCLVCNNPEVPFTTAKLASIKADSKYTTTTQLVKLVNNQLISRISLRIADPKPAKMVRTLNIYYNNRTVQSVVELKNKPGMWHKAKKVSLGVAQTDVKIDFPLPIAACNLMLEYADFYENMQASSETLQCPRCSAGVPASPGVCGNCGENVYQCHKCRAINYDEKDPFLCTACGYCKYAKFDYTLQCRLCCAVDPIECEEDRKKSTTNINHMLEKADASYKQLQAYKPALEALLLKVSEQGGERGLDETLGGGGSVPAAAAGGGLVGNIFVNRTIQQLAQKYCGECKGAFDSLSKLIQRIQACRRELVAFDRSQKEGGKKAVSSPLLPSAVSSPDAIAGASSAMGAGVCRCYGCASAAVQHCITLLRALATRPPLRAALCEHGLIQDLLHHNLRRGNLQVRGEVRELLVLLTQDDLNATQELHLLITARVKTALESSAHLSSPDLAAAVRHEVALLAAAARSRDSCWETRLRCVAQLFLLAGGTNTTPEVLEHVSLPCLRILQHAMTPPPAPAAIKAPAATPLKLGTGLRGLAASIKSSGLPPRKPRTDRSISSSSGGAASKEGAKSGAAGGVIKGGTVSAVMSGQYEKGCRVGVDLHKWLQGDPEHSYEAWKKRSKVVKLDKKPPNFAKMTKREVRERYLSEKYACRWVSRSVRRQCQVVLTTDSGETGWLKQMLFNPASRLARSVASQVVYFLANTSCTWKAKLLDLLTEFLSEIRVAGESGEELVSLYRTLLAELEWRRYLAVRGVLSKLGVLLTQEIQQLTLLEETSLNTDLLQGYALKTVTELLQMFLDEATIKSVYKRQLLPTVLSGYLSLRKLVVQRTKHVDDTQDKLLVMLEDMTSGTEEETRRFMAVCVETVQQYPADDLRTPVFLFERLCSIIHPEENDVGEFFMLLEKDPQQEDFLQGRMNGNPYSSDDLGMGPHMRDIKNKICQDCELVALLEDDSGMELLVANKIISLDLPVKDVYKMWLAENPETLDMRIVYRMRGLMGDATEEFVETLDKKKEEDVDKEEVYRMAAVMAECGGLRVMLDCLQRITDLSYARPLVTVLLKLFQLCVKLRINRSQLLVPSMGAVTVLLHTLKQCLAAEPEVVAGPPGQPTLTEQLLMVLEAVLVEACEMPASDYAELVETCGTLEDIHLLLNYVATSSTTNAQVKQRLMRVLPFLVFCHKEKMELLVGHFRPVLDFDLFDIEHSPEDAAKMESFCVFCSGIERNEIGSQLKDMILRANIVKDALSYIERHIPKSQTVVVVCDDEWKEFLSRPSLKYILRLLTGLACKHQGSQRAVASACIPAIHRLEQISSDEHVGSLAENLLEALTDDAEIAKQVGEVRRQTRQEKKRLAMKTRCKELSRLGLRANDKEQITSQSSLLQHHISGITEEQGLVCAICLEGYRSAPTKVLAIYTYSKRRAVEDRESKPHKTLGYCTVSHFNVVHVECHLAAVKASRSRDEWDSAALHNANTLANGLLPLWGPQVPENAFVSCLARHNNYLTEYTSHRDVTYTWTLHDIKLLLVRFARERSFSEDSGGGGPQSNMNLLPYLLHMALYVMNTTRMSSREERRVDTFLENAGKSLVDSAYEVEGAHFFATLCVAVCSSKRWSASLRLPFLKRLLQTAHVRSVSAVPNHGIKIANKVAKDWTVYKSAAIFWTLIDKMYSVMFKTVSAEGSGEWSVALAEFIRQNDVSLLDSANKLLSVYQSELLPCVSFGEFCDVAGLLTDLGAEPDAFLQGVLDSLP